MPTLPNMGIVTPAIGKDNGTWDDKINAAFALVDAHDHTDGKGVAVPVAGLDIDDDLPMGGFGVSNLGKISFTTITAPTSGSLDLFVNAADNELYWRTSSGTNVKLTNGASINTTLVGGIVGDYASVGAAVAYDDANDRYTFKQQSGTWARLASGPIRIFEFDTTESAYVEHIVAATLAASYTVTWPASLPSNTSPLYISSAGVISTADTEVLTLAPQAGIGNSATQASRTEFQLSPAGGLGFVWYAVRLPEGRTITGFSFRLNKASDNTNTITCELYKLVDGVATSINSQTNAANAPGNITLSATGLTTTIGAGETYVIQITNSDSTPSATDKIFNGTVTWKY